jgi:hypothetical protein
MPAAVRKREQSKAETRSDGTMEADEFLSRAQILRRARPPSLI